MPRRLRPSGALAVVILALATSAHGRPLEPALPGPGAPVGHGAFTHPVEAEAPIPLQVLERATRPRPVAPDEAGRALLYPSYTWPLQHALHDGVNIVNYVDEDSTAGILDYRGGAYTYDTHRGTDIALLDFRGMDRGSRIVAAAPGTVTNAVWYNLRDRNCAVADNPTLNYIEVANGDGTYTYYYHLRANSMTVNVGEAVQRGQMLGMAGSSGYSYGPHLHFEPADWLNGPYLRRDPWAGPDNPNPGLWGVQPPYVGDEPIRVDDIYVTTQTAAGGSLFSIDYCTYFAERMTQPATFGLHEPYLPVVLDLHARAGEAYRVEIHRPNGSLFASTDYTMPSDMAEGIHYWAWYWDGYVTSADYGTWTAVAVLGGLPVRSVGFVVGASTVYPPRFVPRDGHSFRIDGTVQRDTMRVSPLGAPVSYHLVGAPSTVTLVDSILTVGATSTQPTRSAYFNVIATDAAARVDTAWYHVVDPSKPQEPVTAVGPGAPIAAPGLALARPFPDPVRGTTTLRFTLPAPASVDLAIYDLSGRRIATLAHGPADAGIHEAHWNARDGTGARVGAGVYFVRLAASGAHRAERLVVLP